MSKERNPREYFEYNANFLTEIEKIEKETDDKKAEPIVQSLFKIVKETLEISAASSVEKKSILDGFAETIRDNKEKEPETIEAKSIVFEKFAEKLAESLQDDETPTKIFQEYVEQLQAIVAVTKPQKLAQDIFCLPEEEKTPLELGESFLDADPPVFSAADRAIDPITQAIRSRILTKQRELIVASLVEKNIVEKEKIDDLNKFRAYFENEQNKEIISELLKTDKNLKQALEQVEIIGYRNVHTEFTSRFTTMEWKDGIVENANGITIKKQVVRDANGIEIATLAEATHKINPPHTVQKSDGTNVAIHNYRTIDFPITLENQNGPMHLSLAVKDQNGRNIAASKAVYFTAHYDDDGKLIEVSSPHPVKFSGDSPDAVGYIEHGGQIYTLPVTQEKYKAMMQEVAKNLGQGVDISPSIEAPLSVDLTVTSRKDIPDAAGHSGQIKPVPITQEENKAMTQEVSKNLGQGVDTFPSIGVPDPIVTSRQDVEEAQPRRVQENMEPLDIVKREEVVLKVDIPEYAPIPEKVKVIEKKTVEQVHDTPEISQTVSINSDVIDKAESIKASLSKSRHIRPLARKSEEDIAKLVGELSKSLEDKEFKEQKEDIGTTLEKLAPKEKIKLLQGLAKAIAEKRGEEVNKINTKQRIPDADPVRLRIEGREVDEGGLPKIGQTQRIADHANIKDNTKLQTFLLNKISEINEVSKKPIITVKPRSTSPNF
ncbi:MAG: Sca4 family protein [Rickettsia sp.]|jgi:uncharacterized protein (DUF2267 family)|nr:Sca4 family protein [Rickettsia sp.]